MYKWLENNGHHRLTNPEPVRFLGLFLSLFSSISSLARFFLSSTPSGPPRSISLSASLTRFPVFRLARHDP
ncbi:hypothetical protein DL93DRAFT_2091970 [Clavulina sp. PMI_390]|nr:hypothetical protein DL93DRAFT_2091970 [Clavulina sp. PMI_390]